LILRESIFKEEKNTLKKKVLPETGKLLSSQQRHYSFEVVHANLIFKNVFVSSASQDVPLNAS